MGASRLDALLALAGLALAGVSLKGSAKLPKKKKKAKKKKVKKKLVYAKRDTVPFEYSLSENENFTEVIIKGDYSYNKTVKLDKEGDVVFNISDMEMMDEDGLSDLINIVCRQHEIKKGFCIVASEKQHDFLVLSNIESWLKVFDSVSKAEKYLSQLK